MGATFTPTTYSIIIISGSTLGSEREAESNEPCRASTAAAEGAWKRASEFVTLTRKIYIELATRLGADCRRRKLTYKL